MTPLTSDHKTRFGKPVSEPNLAEDIKALFDAVKAGERKIEGKRV